MITPIFARAFCRCFGAWVKTHAMVAHLSLSAAIPVWRFNILRGGGDGDNKSLHFFQVWKLLFGSQGTFPVRGEFQVAAPPPAKGTLFLACLLMTSWSQGLLKSSCWLTMRRRWDFCHLGTKVSRQCHFHFSRALVHLPLAAVMHLLSAQYSNCGFG